ncbi:hypothetical protein L1277_002786 [Okibacterium sp. HSC-33S16]|uniref:VOC family protein n=1 Tax=Okibacterium sp. HSC-33S16 TaxID=2910965 RepID=UPI0020A1B392|nr:hypothetical protein [Okibacterium sp. HSC-33S16]MCP2032676.1 hypothetical protein [Okibacterium sp. HSC-33S16]
MIPRLSIALFRYTDDVPAMIEFLTVLGLRPPAISERTERLGHSTYPPLAGQSTRYVLRATTRAAEVGRTSLGLGTDDLDGTVEALRTSGGTIASWDTAFGRSGRVETTRGPLRIDDISSPSDLDGSHTDTERPERPERTEHVDVLPVLFSSTVATDRDVLTALSFTLDDEREGAELWEAPAGGRLLLHRAHGDRVDQNDWTVAPGIHSDVNPDALVHRLSRIGYTDARLTEGAVHVTDPDGQHVEVHPMPSASSPVPSPSSG